MADRPDAKEVIGRITDLPTLPDVVVRVNELVSDSNASAGDLNDVLSRDVALSAKILKLVNSSFYGFPRRITSIAHAVVILGFNTVRNLALSAFVFSAFRSKTSRFSAEGLWVHCMGAAVAASATARHTGYPQSEDAFMAGLLHDVGKVVMSEFIPDAVEEIVTRARSEGVLFVEAEETLDQTRHAELGGCLLDTWNLPLGIVDVTAHHHSPGESTHNQALCDIAHVADILSRAFCIGDGGDDRIPAVDPGAWDRLGLTREILGRIMDQTLAESRQAESFVSMV